MISTYLSADLLSLLLFCSRVFQTFSSVVNVLEITAFYFFGCLSSLDSKIIAAAFFFTLVV